MHFQLLQMNNPLFGINQIDEMMRHYILYKTIMIEVLPLLRLAEVE